MGKREFVLILSDIHMGVAAPTVWYRKEVHEKYLMNILDNIISNADSIQEVILLGDIFEFWNYPPDVLPPKMEDIIAENPNILGVEGKLREALCALKGRMIFIPGEHDMAVTQLDLVKLKSMDGHFIKYHQDFYIPPYDSHILFTHGHTFALLEAPFYRSKIAPLPMAYLMERAASYQVQKELKRKGLHSIAESDGYGGYQLSDFFPNIAEQVKDTSNLFSFFHQIVEEISDSTNLPLDNKIKINRSTSISLREAKNLYKNLFETYPNNFKNYGLPEQFIQYSALQADFLDHQLTWFVQKTLGYFVDTVVMGHTHHPTNQVEKGSVHYINTGSFCPSIPYMTKNPITYAIYSKTKHAVSLMKICDARLNLEQLNEDLLKEPRKKGIDKEGKRLF